MIIFWHWEVATGRTTWKSQRHDFDQAALPDAGGCLFGDPLVTVGAEPVRLSEALATLNEGSVLAATIANWPDRPELEGARSTGNVRRPVAFRHRSRQSSPSAAAAAPSTIACTS